MLPEGRDPTMHFLSLSLQNSVDLQHLSQVVPQQSTPFAQQPVPPQHCSVTQLQHLVPHANVPEAHAA